MTRRSLYVGSDNIQGSAHVDYGPISGSLTHGSEKSPVIGVDFYSHTGYETPHFHAKKKAGNIIPFTDWFQKRCIGAVTEAEFNMSNSSTNYRQQNHGLYHYAATTEWCKPRLTSENTLSTDYGVDFEAIGRDQVQAAAASIYSRGWDGLTFVSELHKVVSMFRGLLRKISATDPKELTRMWLEGRYGWRILVYDIMDINKLIQNIDEGRERFKQSVGTSGRYDNVTLETIQNSGGIWIFSHRDEIDWSIRGSIVADISPPEISINPVLTAWELITYSFVIDWIIDIGQWLESMSFLVLANEYTAARGLQMTHKRTTEQHVYVPMNGYVGTGAFKSTCTTTITRRLPTSVSKLPSFGINLNVLKVVDILALLSRFFK